VAALVAIGKAAYKKRIERGARDDAKLTEFGDGLREAPVRHAYAHSALNDFGKLDHVSILSHIRINTDIFSQPNPILVMDVSNTAHNGRISEVLGSGWE
jgi:hypothetical protein